MEAQKTQNEAANQSGSSAPPAMSSCRKNKRDDATFLQDVKDHIDEFIHASMDEHKECFKKTMNKMFGMTRKVGERNAEQGVESVLPLQATVSK